MLRDDRACWFHFILRAPGPGLVARAVTFLRAPRRSGPRRWMAREAGWTWAITHYPRHAGPSAATPVVRSDRCCAPGRGIHRNWK
jgi:hypothetical protein